MRPPPCMHAHARLILGDDFVRPPPGMHARARESGASLIASSACSPTVGVVPRICPDARLARWI